MNAARQMDYMIATKILNHPVHKQKNVYYESTPKGTRPLREYSKKIEDAWEVAQAMGITLIPILDGSWFALVGPREGWKDPGEFLQCLQSADFMRSGAGVSETAPMSICLAAVSAYEKRNPSPEAVDAAANSAPPQLQ